MSRERSPRAQRSRRAIVTGGAGFVGSHLADRLIEEDFEVLVLDDLSTGLSGQVPPRARFEAIDIAMGPLDEVMAAWRPAVVFHLAAQASVPLSADDPARDLAVNGFGTYRVTEAARNAGAERLVFVSSGGAIYGETDRPATEGTTPAPASYYGIHKLLAEGYVGVGGVPYSIVRPSNIYGPRQRAGLEGAVVATYVEQGARLGRVAIHGTGRQTRDFVHVTDVVVALLLLAGAELPSGTWNVSTGRPTSIVELADLVQSLLGRRIERIARPARVGDVVHSTISPRALRSLGWRPSISLAAGLAGLIPPVGREGDA